MWFFLIACLQNKVNPELTLAREGCGQGDAKACRNEAILLQEGEKPEVRAALVLLEQQCTAGDVRACGMALLLLRQGTFQKSLPENLLMETALMERACDGGFARICMELGERVWSTDPERANETARRACERSTNGYYCGLARGDWPWEPPPQPELPADFAARLREGGLSFQLPAQFAPVPIQENPDLSYHYAIAHQSGNLELRFAVMPLAPLFEDYNACKKPGCAMVHPDKIGETMLQATWMNLSAQPGQGPPPNPFPDVAARLEFNADWGKVTGFPPRPTFAKDWPVAAMVGLHRDGQADVVIVALMKNMSATAELWPAAFHALRFVEPVGLGSVEL